MAHQPLMTTKDDFPLETTTPLTLKALHEFATESQAEAARLESWRLGRRPFSIFLTARSTWAFWTP